MDYWDNIAQFTLESRVEICAALDSSQAVAVCQFCEDADVAMIFELDTCVFFLVILVGQFRSRAAWNTDEWPFISKVCVWGVFLLSL
jgi:hypothetical protein